MRFTPSINTAGSNGEKIPTFFSRKQLCNRWGLSLSSLKRMEKTGDLVATVFGKRLVRYPASLILEIENR
jgi:hypothetical protein